MKKLKVAVADCNETFLQAMESIIRMDSELQLLDAVSDGNELYDLMREKEPDVVVVDLILKGIDGFSLLERAQKDSAMKKNPKFILTSNINSDRIIQDAFYLGASYFLLKPFNTRILPERIKQVASSGEGERTGAELETAVTMVETAPMRQEPKDKDTLTQEELCLLICDYLCRMGVPSHLKGYRYLGSGIEMCAKDISKVEAITKELYPGIARIYSTEASRVERAIRHAIEVAWERGNINEQNEMFGYTINLRKGRPTNSEFIAMLANRIRLEYKV